MPRDRLAGFEKEHNRKSVCHNLRHHGKSKYPAHKTRFSALFGSRNGQLEMGICRFQGKQRVIFRSI
jgi:hypothetical protein